MHFPHQSLFGLSRSACAPVWDRDLPGVLGLCRESLGTSSRLPGIHGGTPVHCLSNKVLRPGGGEGMGAISLGLRLLSCVSLGPPAVRGSLFLAIDGMPSDHGIRSPNYAAIIASLEIRCHLLPARPLDRHTLVAGESCLHSMHATSSYPLPSTSSRSSLSSIQKEDCPLSRPQACFTPLRVLRIDVSDYRTIGLLHSVSRQILRLLLCC
jgi:hypothetical protein